jgi:hypothetical protein
LSTLPLPLLRIMCPVESVMCAERGAGASAVKRDLREGGEDIVVVLCGIWERSVGASAGERGGGDKHVWWILGMYLYDSSCAMIDPESCRGRGGEKEGECCVRARVYLRTEQKAEQKAMTSKQPKEKEIKNKKYQTNEAEEVVRGRC